MRAGIITANGLQKSVDANFDRPSPWNSLAELVHEFELATFLPPSNLSNDQHEALPALRSRARGSVSQCRCSSSVICVGGHI